MTTSPNSEVGEQRSIPAQRLLLVDDEARIRRVLRLAFEDEGYQVLEATNGAEALAVLRRDPPDVVLLDLMLPDQHGFGVCREIRRDSDVPVIMVTARTDSHDVVAGLEAGADDYVTKPLVAKELSARIRAVMRRIEPASRPPSLQFIAGDLRIDVASLETTRGGVPLPLTRTEFKLLAELAGAEGAVCSREHLLSKVWGYGYFGDSRIVDVHIRRLRLKVERDPASPQHVVTARGLGYRLVA
ncbi:DNA-binding response OmpR family regulator [Kribbella orskensis]|uniref:DNA-binding response OmpR family regulator n=1 Tax=Kribbella orskensis TaxID=2512216 RepID=A0ABY2BA46_9ACTN|nr:MULTISPECIES: response regulator transcription factor [Kribbella]TCN32867.1 DNA-binding response OmpR family regulator [Kribbella sp. VKM Ac-2500]TCO13259.1 DNA-binding response OmpR family regulator [Kribbella orskensis]